LTLCIIADVYTTKKDVFTTMKSMALKLIAMSKKIKKVSMLCIVGMHDWVPNNPFYQQDGKRCRRCGRFVNGE
jgi:hypothetical protein